MKADARKVREAEQNKKAKERAKREKDNLLGTISENSAYEIEGETVEDENKDIEDLEDKSKSEKSKAEISFMKRNVMKISNTTSASIRFGVSDRAAAAVVNGFLKDLIEAGHLDQSKSYLAIDQSKVAKSKQDVMSSAREKGERESCESNIK